MQSKQKPKSIFMCTYRDSYYINTDSYNIPKGNKFVISNDSDFDYRKMERSFSGRLTKGRYKLLDRICRYYSRSPRYRCGHDYDCCGCLCGQRMEFTYKHNQVTITITQSFNY